MIKLSGIKKRFEGSIALTLVLVISTILLVNGIAVLLLSVDLSGASKDHTASVLGRMRNRSCLEEALNKVKSNNSFTGTASITYVDGSCSADVQNDPLNSNIRIINLNSVVGNFHINETKRVDVSVMPFQILD